MTRSTKSPAEWPNVSLYDLNQSASDHDYRKRQVADDRKGEARIEDLFEPPAVGQVGQGVGRCHRPQAADRLPAPLSLLDQPARSVDWPPLAHAV